MREHLVRVLASVGSAALLTVACSSGARLSQDEATSSTIARNLPAPPQVTNPDSPLRFQEQDYSGGTSDAPRLAGLGDSITKNSTAEPVLNADGRPLVDTTGRTIYADPIKDALGDSVRSRFSAVLGSTIADRQGDASYYAQDRPEIVYIHLGTNDAWSGGRVTRSQAVNELETMRGKFGQSCQIVTTISEQGTQTPTADGRIYDRAFAMEFNAHIRGLTNDDVVVLDWGALTSAHPEYLHHGTNDGIHPSSEGKFALATAIRNASDECRSRERG
jgi:lysophospholipase L1-like esterase